MPDTPSPSEARLRIKPRRKRAVIKDQKEDLNIKKGLRGHALFSFISSSFIEKLFIITRLFYRLIKTAHIRAPSRAAERPGGRRHALITWSPVRFPRARPAPPHLRFAARFPSKLTILCRSGAPNFPRGRFSSYREWRQKPASAGNYIQLLIHGRTRRQSLIRAS